MSGIIFRFRVMAIWAGVLSGFQLCMALPTQSTYWQLFT